MFYYSIVSQPWAFRRNQNKAIENMPRRNFPDAYRYSSSSSDSNDDSISQTDENDGISPPDSSSSSEQDSLETSSSIPDDLSTHLPHQPSKIRLQSGRLTFRSPSDHASEDRQAKFLEEFQQVLQKWYRFQERPFEDNLEVM